MRPPAVAGDSHPVVSPTFERRATCPWEGNNPQKAISLFEGFAFPMTFCFLCVLGDVCPLQLKIAAIKYCHRQQYIICDGCRSNC